MQLETKLLCREKGWGRRGSQFVNSRIVNSLILPAWQLSPNSLNCFFFLPVSPSCFISRMPGHRRRSRSSHSSTIWKLQRSSPLEQSARRVLRDNSRCPSGMLTLTHPVQLAPRTSCRKYSMTNIYLNLHWWKAHMQPMICRRHRSYGRQEWWTQDLTDRLVQNINGI